MATKPLQKGRENRSADKKDVTFHPYTITPETAYTSILLLESKEPEILCQCLRALTKFASQDMQNRYQMFNLHAIKYILPHIDHQEINIRRFALKALAQLCQLPKGPEQVLGDSQNMRRISNLVAKNEDVFVLEFASLVLAELTREPVGCEQLVSANILSSLFNRMKNSTDPDVQKNCLQTLSNLLHDPICATEVTKNPQFNWQPLLALMQSKYLAIQQLSLYTVDQLVARYKDVNVQKSFKASTGVLDLCDILESYEFRDVHVQVLGVLQTYVGTAENADHLYQAGCINRLLAYLDMALPSMKPHCIAVLTKMSFTENGRKALFETGTDLVFCTHLLSSNVDLLANAAMGVANMTKMMDSATRMADTNIIDALAAIIGDENAAWFSIRINALLAMVELCRLIPKAAFAIVEPRNFGPLRNINKKSKDSPIEAQRLAVQCYINLLKYSISLRAMLNADFISELLNIMQRIDIQLKIQATTAMTGLMSEDIAKYLFSSKRGEAVVSDTLKIEHIGLRTATCLLISASVCDDGADVYHSLNTIQYMIENKQARYCVPAWEPALEAIFRCHPSAKLAYTGRLDINDFTAEGFYVMKRMSERFPTMQEIVETPSTQPVFVALFYHSSNTRDLHGSFDIRTPHRLSTARMSNSSRLRFPAVPDDFNLRDYMKRLRIWFGDPTKSLQYIEMEDAHWEVRWREKCTEVSSLLKHRAQLLGEFVAEQMSGLDQERDCSLPSVDLHLSDLMLEMNSRVIGIGWVRCGGALERAILYKVLADRMGLPCALYRATSAHAWCEVAVPDFDPEDQKTLQNYPAGLLRANYVVDLMVTPGRLVSRGSREAQDICGPACTPLYVARKPPLICKCDTSLRSSIFRARHC